MDLENFENDIFFKNNLTNPNQIIQRNFLMFFLKTLSENISRIIPKNKSSKGALVLLLTCSHQI
jgi:hypothetical protein